MAEHRIRMRAARGTRCRGAVRRDGAQLPVEPREPRLTTMRRAACSAAAPSLPPVPPDAPPNDLPATHARTRCVEADFQSLAETLSSLIALVRGERIVYVNPAACALLGRPREWFVGRGIEEVVHPDDRAAALARARARATGCAQPTRVTERLVHADGRTVWMDWSIDVVIFEGQPTTLCTGHDVTAQRRIAEELAHSEARLAEAQRIASIGSWEWDVLADRIVWSDEMCRIFGVTPAEFGAAFPGYVELVHPDDRAMARTVIAQALAEGGSFAFEHRIVRRDGGERTIFGRGEVFRDGAGRVVRVAGTGQDISEKRRMEQQLHSAEERFRLAFTHSAIGKGIVSADRRILQANPAACRILGYAEHELVGLDPDATIHPDDRPRVEALERELVDGGRVSGGLEARMLRKDGNVVRAQLTTTVVRDVDGRPLYFLGEIQDVTERLSAEQALRDSEERFRNLCLQAPVMLMAFDAAGRVRDVSDLWLQKMGYRREQVVGHEGLGFITPASRERLLEAVQQNRSAGQLVIRNLPLQGIRRDGSTIDLLSTSVAQLGDGGEKKGAICVQLDLTELQRAEATLRESEERYRALVEHAPEAIMVLDVELDRFVDANAHAEKLFGYTRERLLQMGPLDFCPERQADERKSCEVVEAEHGKVLDGGTAVFEFTHVDASGREIVCQTRLSRLPAVGRQLIRTTITDVTELKHLQDKVRHAEKLAAVGVLAAGVAHEIGNPLMALSMAAQSLERKTSDGYSQAKLALIREHIDRIARIVRQMSDLARPAIGRRTACDLNRLVRAAVDMVRYDRRARNAEVRYELAEGLPPLDVAADELTQVFVNLALNAFDAMADNDAARPRRLTVRSAAGEDAVAIRFTDTGPGVPRAQRPKLFQPFFTTKEVGQGTGLGLSVSLRIVQEHRGTLALDETVADGASFVLTLPAGAAR
jgi:two-component system cell cycle sensor histidine kinase/response regulator CckA